MLTSEQATEIAKSLSTVLWEQMTELQRQQLIIGVMGMCQAMISIGYRITPPLKVL